MNARLKKTVDWYSGLVYDDRFMVNYYTADLYLTTVSADHNEQNIAYERLRFWVREILNDSIIIKSNSEMLPIYTGTGARIIALPEDPVDQIVGMMLYLKFNAIMQNRIVVTDVDLSSMQGDNMSYFHSHGEDLGPYLSQEGWWTDPRPCWSLNRPKNDGKVVSLDRLPEWKDCGLDWDDEEKVQNHTVLFAKFGSKDDDK